MSGGIFGQTISCECGKTHHVLPREVLYSDNAVQQFPSLCGRIVDARRAAVLMDVRTRAVAGHAVARALAEQGWTVQEIVVPDTPEGHSPVCNDVTRDMIGRRIKDCDLLVPVGGGVVCDLARWTAEMRSLPFAVFATAASMNGYASASVAGTVKGVKTLIYAHAPGAVASSPEILRNAPYELTASGLGDILAKSVSGTDWYLNHLLFGDYYCARSVQLISDLEPMYLEHPEAVLAREPAAIETLFQALLLTGVAMNMAETSAPCSGGEHMVSHVLDMMAGLDGSEHDLHGRQVGVGTVLTAEFYRRVLEIDSPEFNASSPQIDQAFWGNLAENVAGHYGRKVPRLRTAAKLLSVGNRWDNIRSALQPMLRSPRMIRECLRKAKAADSAEKIGCTRERVLQALLHGHEIRDRFTILDLARLIGVLPAAAPEIVEQWA